MPSILFVCTANQFRSPIAAACLLKMMEKERAAETWIVESAGTWTRDGVPAPKIALQAARRIDVHGLHGHVTRQINRVLLDRYDLIIVMESGHKESISSEFPAVGDRLYLLSEIVDGVPYDIPDPGHAGTDPNEIAREISLLIIRGREKILQLATSLSKLQLQ